MEPRTFETDHVWRAAQAIVIEEGRLLDEMNPVEQTQFFLEIAHRTQLPEPTARSLFEVVAHSVTLSPAICTVPC